SVHRAEARNLKKCAGIGRANLRAESTRFRIWSFTCVRGVVNEFSTGRRCGGSKHALRLFRARRKRGGLLEEGRICCGSASATSSPLFKPLSHYFGGAI